MKNLVPLWSFWVFAVLLCELPLHAVELTEWETYQPREEEDAQKVADELISQIKNEYTTIGFRTFRDAHPRGIACVAAKFTVDSNLADQYQAGVFAEPGKSYDAIIRFSSALGPAGDNEKDARGMAIKLFGVTGTKLLADQADAVTHDFLQINSPIFPAKNARDFAGIVSIKTDPKNVVKFLMESPISRALALKALNDSTKGNPNNGKSLLAMQFFSQTAYLFQSASLKSPVKFSSRPCGPIAERKLDGTTAELRNDLQERLNEKDACFEFTMQFYKEGVGFEVENGMSEWKESKSSFIKFATIKIPKQSFLTDEKLRYCDALSFQPWHALDFHRPLGNINRTRKIVYERLSKFRHEANSEMQEFDQPQDLAKWNSFKSETYSAWKDVKVPVDGR